MLESLPNRVTSHSKLVIEYIKRKFNMDIWVKKATFSKIGLSTKIFVTLLPYEAPKLPERSDSNKRDPLLKTRSRKGYYTNNKMTL